MNIFFNSKKSAKGKIPALYIIYYAVCFGVIGGCLMAFTYFFFHHSSTPVEAPVEEPGFIITIHAFSVVEEIAISYGIPAGPMGRLSRYFEENAYNEKYGGIGLFSVRPSHLGWLKDSVLADTRIDLEDPIQNTQVAAYILRRFYVSGYSWQNSFLIYTFGFSAVNDDGYSEFLKYIFPGE